MLTEVSQVTKITLRFCIFFVIFPFPDSSAKLRLDFLLANPTQYGILGIFETKTTELLLAGPWSLDSSEDHIPVSKDSRSKKL